MSEEGITCKQCKTVVTERRAYCPRCGEILAKSLSRSSSPGPVASPSFGHRKVSRGRDPMEEMPDMIRFTNKLLEIRVKDKEEYSSGVLFCQMIKTISPSTAIRYNENPRMVLQKLNNVASALQAMETMGIRSGGINSKEIVGGDAKQIVTVLTMLNSHWRKLPGNSSGSSPTSSPARADLPPAAAVTRAQPKVTPPKAQPKAEPKPEPKVEPKVEPKAQPKPEPQVEPKVEAKQPEPVVADAPPKITMTPVNLEAVEDLPEPTKVATTKMTPRSAKEDSLNDISNAESKQEKELEELDAKLLEMTQKLKALSSAYAAQDEVNEDATASGAESEATSAAGAPAAAEEAATKEPKEPLAAVKAPKAAASPTVPKKPSGGVKRRTKKRRRRRKKSGQHASPKTDAAGSKSPSAVRQQQEALAEADSESFEGESDSPEHTEEDTLVDPRVIDPNADDSGEEEGQSDSAEDDEGEEEDEGDSQASPAPAAAQTKSSKKPKKKRRPKLEKLRDIDASQVAAAAEAQAILAQQKAAKQQVKSSLMDDPAHLTAVRISALESKYFGEANLSKGMVRLQSWKRMKDAQRKRKMLGKRAHIAKEVVYSEQSYVKSLGQCIEHFYNPMRTMSSITELQIRQMFSEMAVILGYNTHLCTQLEKRQREWSKSGQRLGDIFMDLVAYFRTYTSYVNNYNEAMKLFYEMKKKNKAFAQFLMEKKMEPSLNGIELPAFLIMPIQRLPRYVMLLEDLLKNTPKDHADFEGLSAALVKVQEVADYVNEKKRQAENINQVMEVQSRLTGHFKSLAEPHRRFVRQGNLADLEHSKGDRTLFLFNDLLVIGKENSSMMKLAGNALMSVSGVLTGKKSRTPKLSRKSKSPFVKKKASLSVEDDHSTTWKYQERVTLFDAKIRTVDLSVDMKDRKSSRQDFEWGFQVSSPKFTANLGCQSHDEMMGWVRDIDEAAMKLVQRKRDRAENLAMQDREMDLGVFSNVPDAPAIPDISTASYKGELFVNKEEGRWHQMYFYVVGLFLYFYKRKSDKEPLGWFYLLRSDVMLDEPFQSGHSFLLSVPRLGGKGCSESADSIAQGFLSTDEEVLVLLGDSSVNDCLAWFRALRHAILDAVKQGVEMCPLVKIQDASPDNRHCADCGREPAEKASTNLGVFLCAECAQIHGGLPAGMSVIRDVNEPWEITTQQSYELEALMGNDKRNAIFEKNIGKSYKRPKHSDSRELKEKWIRAKYLGVADDAASHLVVGERRKKRLSMSSTPKSMLGGE